LVYGDQLAAKAAYKFRFLLGINQAGIPLVQFLYQSHKRYL
jgi:hypothetical protein